MKFTHKRPSHDTLNWLKLEDSVPGVSRLALMVMAKSLWLFSSRGYVTAQGPEYAHMAKSLGGRRRMCWRATLTEKAAPAVRMMEWFSSRG